MRFNFVIGAAALLAAAAASTPADAARWCAGGACDFTSLSQCVRATGSRAACHTARRAAPRYAPAPAYGGVPDWPSRPPWAAPGECYIDNGYGRYSSCDAAGGGRS